MRTKPKGGADIPGQKYVPQVERYLGSDVLGMEYTTARPMSWATGANPEVPMPGVPWVDDCCTMCHRAEIKGKKVATFAECD